MKTKDIELKLSADEKLLFEKMNKLFGKNLQRRLGKLSEEYDELLEAIERRLQQPEIRQREKLEIIPDRNSEIIDELADLNAVLFHIAALFGYSQKELLQMAYNKISGRETDPNFMRKHEHEPTAGDEKTEKACCGNCELFYDEDVEGNGRCKAIQEQTHCSCSACIDYIRRKQPTQREYEHFTDRFNKML